MYKAAKIICPTCKKEFLPKSPKNIYSSRSCFKKAYYHQKKAEELNNIKFPIFLCPSCGKKVELSFDPVKEDRRWEKFCCPHCSVLMISVCENIVTQDASLV